MSEEKPNGMPSDLAHQVRQVAAGLLAFGAGLYDAWAKGTHEGFDISFDTVLILTGLYLISGVQTLAPGQAAKPPPPTERKP